MNKNLSAGFLFAFFQNFNQTQYLTFKIKQYESISNQSKFSQRNINP